MQDPMKVTFSGIPSFLKVIQYLLTSSNLSFLHFYPSFHFSFNNVSQKALPRQEVTYPASLHSMYCMQDVPLHRDPM